MKSFKEVLGHQMLVLEGAMGTMLQSSGLLSTGAPEALNLIEPDSITRIHSFYRLAGADCAITNTFGANRSKLAHYGMEDSVEEINRKGVSLARKAAVPYVLANIGPTGSAGAGFDQMYDIFFEQAAALASAKPDAFLLETFTNIAEIRVAIFACKAAAPDLPIIASLSFSESGRVELSGTDPEAAAIILESLGVAAIGINCSLGPDQMEPLARELRAATNLPIVVQPNAGMPTLAADGSTVFPGTPKDFTTFAQNMMEAGISAIGSCCGSDPEFTAAIVDVTLGAECARSGEVREFGMRIASPQQALHIGGVSAAAQTEAAADAAAAAAGASGKAKPNRSIRRATNSAPLRTIGERINPTGKPALKAELQAGSMTLVRTFAAQQQAAGADILDINVGVAGIDEAAMLCSAVSAVSGAIPVPLALDTTNPEALEAALRAYPGKALVNSVTGEERSLSAVLPLVAHYGAAVVVLALDDNGIPDTAEGRLEIVRAVRDRARYQYGIPDSDLLVDSLVMAAAADKNAPQVTFDTVRLVREELGLATVLGVSNVSHGLPNRPQLNAAFLATAAGFGLDAAIVNPNEEVMAQAVSTINEHRKNIREKTLSRDARSQVAQAHIDMQAFKALLEDALKPRHIPTRAAAHAQQAASDTTATTGAPDTAAAAQPQLPLEERLAHAIALGDIDGAPQLVDALINKGSKPTDIIEHTLTPAIQDLGNGFAEGTVFLPQLMVAADAMKAAVDRAKEYLPKPPPPEEQNPYKEINTEDDGFKNEEFAPKEPAQRTVVFATVKGDIHSIGKDICCSLLECQSVNVINLGVDVSTARIIKAVQEHKAGAVCLSALMTTTLPAMVDSTKALQKQYPGLPVLLGGAVVTEEWAQQQGAHFEKDAPALAARIVKLLDKE